MNFDVTKTQLNISKKKKKKKSNLDPGMLQAVLNGHSLSVDREKGGNITLCIGYSAVTESCLVVLFPVCCSLYGLGNGKLVM